MMCSKVKRHRLDFCAILWEQHKRPIFCAACLKSSQEGKEEEWLLSQAQGASATIKPAERGYPFAPSPLRQHKSKRYETEPGKQRPSKIASTSKDMTLEALYQPWKSAADERMAWSLYSGVAEGKGAPSY